MPQLNIQTILPKGFPLKKTKKKKKHSNSSKSASPYFYMGGFMQFIFPRWRPQWLGLVCSVSELLHTSLQCAEFSLLTATSFEPAHEIINLFVSVNSFSKRACAAIQWGYMSDLWPNPSSTSILHAFEQ